MPRLKKEIIESRNQDIALAYKMLASIKDLGVQKLKHEYIVEVLHNIFYLSPDYIEHLLRTNEPKDGFNSSFTAKSIHSLIHSLGKPTEKQGKLF